MRHSFYFAFIAFLYCGNIWSQGETSNWYFGRGAGVHFNNDGTVEALADGKLATNEGCASLSDANGNLLFYTDGITVYNRNHEIMDEGNGLYGDPSSTQSALIVPKPDDPKIFYIFTVDTSVQPGDPDFGLNYSVVDISENNGVGKIIQKNINLLPNCSEKITAVLKNCLDKSIWLITFSSQTGAPGVFNTFHAFEINSTGVSATSVPSTFPDLAIQDPRGYLKLSSDGSKLACANFSQGLFLYDFDADTGVVSNERPIRIKANNKAAYGIEFSPNNQFLYAHTSNNAQGIEGHYSSLIQFDLTAFSIESSEVVIHNDGNYRGALQLASNGKIYRTIADSYDFGSPFLGAINNPDKKGADANYEHNAVNLGSKISMQGLPPFIQSFFNKTQIVINADGSTSSGLEICDGEPIELEAPSYPGATYNWSKDQVPFTNSGPVLTIPISKPEDSGRYSVTIKLADPMECPIYGEAVVKVNSLPNAFPSGLVQCDIDDITFPPASDGITSFNLREAFADILQGGSAATIKFYESNLDRINNKPISNSIGYRNTTPFNQTLYVKVIAHSGCESFTTLELDIQTSSNGLTRGNPQFACDTNPDDTELTGIFDLAHIESTEYNGFDITFYITENDAILEQNQINSTSFETESTILFVRKEINNQCQGIDQINLTIEATPKIFFPSEHHFCSDGNPLSLSAETGYDEYRWYRRQENGTDILVSSERTVIITEPGDYSLEVGYLYRQLGPRVCWNRTSFTTIPSNRAIIEEIIVKDLSDNNTVTIIVSGDGDYEYALNDEFGFYQDLNIFDNLAAGIHTVYVRDKKGCGTSIKKVSVIGYPKFFTPNGDLANDYWQILGVGEEFQPASLIYIFNRYGAPMAQVDPTSKGWDGTFNGAPLPSSDYWFRVLLEDGRELKGHFTLKR